MSIQNPIFAEIRIWFFITSSFSFKTDDDGIITRGFSLEVILRISYAHGLIFNKPILVTKMTRWFLLIILTLFQDSFVRLGTVFGIALGYGSLQVLGGEPWVNMSAFGFIGWGLGAYLCYYRSHKTPISRPPKFKVHQGGR